MGNPLVNCDNTLYSLVFGESVLNDAVAIVLFHTMGNLAERGTTLSTFGDWIMVILEFVGVALGSMLLGAALALIACLMCKHSGLSRYPSKEMTVLLMFVYASYAVGEAVELSGVMSLFFCGIVLAHYNMYNLSDITSEASTYIFRSLAHCAESLVFAYVGMVGFTGQYTTWSAALFFIAFSACLLGRALNIFPLTALVNLRRKVPISFRMQGVMWFAGLRGAIAFALATNMPEPDDSWRSGNSHIVTATLLIVVVTTTVFGPATSPLLAITKLSSPAQAEEVESDGERAEFEAMFARAPDGTPLLPQDSPGPRHSKSGMHRAWKRFDHAFMRPLFGGPNPAEEARRQRQGGNAMQYTGSAADSSRDQSGRSYVPLSSSSKANTPLMAAAAGYGSGPPPPDSFNGE